MKYLLLLIAALGLAACSGGGGGSSGGQVILTAKSPKGHTYYMGTSDTLLAFKIFDVNNGITELMVRAPSAGGPIYYQKKFGSYTITGNTINVNYLYETCYPPVSGKLSHELKFLRGQKRLQSANKLYRGFQEFSPV